MLLEERSLQWLRQDVTKHRLRALVLHVVATQDGMTDQHSAKSKVSGANRLMLLDDRDRRLRIAVQSHRHLLAEDALD